MGSESIARSKGQAAYTLVEVVVAVALVAILAIGLFASGIMVRKMTHANRVSLEARTLGIQLIEELSANDIPNLALIMPFEERTNRLQFGEVVLRNAEAIGHDTNGSIVSNLVDSTYVELHVDVSFLSPLTRKTMINSFSTIVK